MKRLIGMVGSALVVATLVAGSVFAGGSSGGGGDNGNKSGNWHKKDYRGCTDGYSLQYAYYAYAYDLNEDGWICQKWVDGEYHYVDNMANSD